MASKAHVILEAVKLSINAEPAQLHRFLSEQPILKLETILRILLTYLPETLDPQSYRDLLEYLVRRNVGTLADASPAELRFSHDQLSSTEARNRVRHLHLLPLVRSHNQESDVLNADPFTQFLIHRAYRIEAETGSLPLVAQLVEPFLDRSEHLRTWAISTLLPLLRLDYEYYANVGPTYSLEAFEKLSGKLAVQGLLSKVTESNNGNTVKEIGRDLRGLVGPWTYGQRTSKRRKLEGVARRRSSVVSPTSGKDDFVEPQESNSLSWAHVNDWLLDISTRDYPRAVEAILQWDGPRDVDYGNWDGDVMDIEEDAILNAINRYAQTGLAIIYSNNTASIDVTKGSHSILKKMGALTKVASVPNLSIPDATLAQEISKDYIETLLPTNLLQNALQRPQNPLTAPSKTSFSLAYLLLLSNHILHSLGPSKPCRSLLDLAMFSNETDQLAELRKVLHGLSAGRQDENSWDSSRQKILWLQNWSYNTDVQYSETPTIACGLFSKVATPTLESEILKAMLAGISYQLVVSIYCKPENPPLPLTVVEKTVIDAALASYDSASNGNRTRGGVRKASEIITTFQPYFPESDSFHRISALLKATHAMSFYSLTLQHGVPFQPVNIRVHRDPMQLVGTILEQNPGSYTKLDDLLDIGQNLVAAGLSTTSNHPGALDKGEEENAQQSSTARRRVTGMAIEAALGEDDFDTAYSYVVNRLSQISKVHLDEESGITDDVSWRAAYKAGCYKPTETAGPSTLRRLEQRMELLSQALQLAPPSALTDMLGVWSKCEQDLNVALAQEAKAEEKWDDRGDRKIPGGFSADSPPRPQKSREPSRAAMNEEAPMGLFDVARGAAATLSKNAFPLRSPRKSADAGPLQSVHERSLSKMSAGGSDSGSGTDAEGRVRKRDMVSNMVTGGLASGIGWVLGAPPVREQEN